MNAVSGQRLTGSTKSANGCSLSERERAGVRETARNHHDLRQSAKSADGSLRAFTPLHLCGKNVQLFIRIEACCLVFLDVGRWYLELYCGRPQGPLRLCV